MMDQYWINIAHTILGGLIVTGSSWFLEIQREKSRNIKLKELIMNSIKDDLENSLALYDNIINYFDKTGVIWVLELNNLRYSREAYKNNKDWIVLFEKKVRKDIYHYYLGSNNLIDSLQDDQKRVYELKNEISSLNMDLGEHLIQEINRLKKEDIKYITETSIPQKLAQLREYKSTAQRILNNFEDQSI